MSEMQPVIIRVIDKDRKVHEFGPINLELEIARDTPSVDDWHKAAEDDAIEQIKADLEVRISQKL